MIELFAIALTLIGISIPFAQAYSREICNFIITRAVLLLPKEEQEDRLDQWTNDAQDQTDSIRRIVSSIGFLKIGVTAAATQTIAHYRPKFQSIGRAKANDLPTKSLTRIVNNPRLPELLESLSERELDSVLKLMSSKQISDHQIAISFIENKLLETDQEADE